MFGFLNPRTCDLAYRSLYARCCQHQRAHFGLLSLPYLSYEATFLYALGLDLGAAGAFEPPSARCCKLSRRGMDDPPDADLGRYVAAVGALLASVKLDDDARDSRLGVARGIAQAKRRLLSQRLAQYHTILDEICPRLSRQLVAHLERHVELEKAVDSLSIEEFSTATALAYEDLFDHLSVFTAEHPFEAELRAIGRHLGTATLMYDCSSDWRDDLKHTLPNPVRNDALATQARELASGSLAAAKMLLHDMFGESGRSTRIVAAVEGRLTKKGQFAAIKCGTLSPALEPGEPAQASVVLNATCCVPCGDGAIAIDSDEAGKCCCNLCWGTCCWIGICYCCCNNAWK